MDQKRQEKIALFRFGVISLLTGMRKTEKGQRERMIQEITEMSWEIPYSNRSYISRSTVLMWLKRYMNSRGDLRSLMPKRRSDRGRSKSIDKETQRALVNMRQEYPGVSVSVLLDMARDNEIIGVNFSASIQSVYRLFKRHGLDEAFSTRVLKKFEAELPNDLWQSDCMHGPQIVDEGKKRKAYLFAIIDDHSRLIVHAEFYLRENLDNYIDCLQKALRKRGLPRKLYLDNGPSFRAHRLKYSTASLGIALIHATAYHPEGKGKIERWFKTVRSQFLPKLKSNLPLQELNEKLQEWINHHYHLSIHSSTKDKPLDRFTKSIHLLRSAPVDLNDAFRNRIKRKVSRDRTVSISNKLFEAPVGLAGKTISLLFHADEPGKIEVIYKEALWGFLKPLDLGANYRVKKIHSQSDKNPPTSGKLFN